MLIKGSYNVNGLEVFLKVLPLLVSVVLGYFLYHKGFLKDEYIDGFKKIVVNVTLPAGLLLAFASIDFELKFVLVFISVFAACAVMLVFAKLTARLFKIKSPYFPFLLTGFEAGMLGYALYGGIHGIEKLSEFGIIDVGQVLFVFIITVPLVSGIGRKREGNFFSQSFSTAVRSPVIWSIIIGLLISITGLAKFSETLLYITVSDVFNFISKPTPLLIGLVVGSGLKFSFLGMKKEILTAGTKVILSTMLAIVINILVLKPLGLSVMLKYALLTMFVLPGPFIIPVFMESSDRNEVEYVSNTLSIGTIMALVGAVIVSLL